MSRCQSNGSPQSLRKAALKETKIGNFTYWLHRQTHDPSRFQTDLVQRLLNGNEAIFATNHSLTHSWSRALLEKPQIVQLLENFPAFYGTRRFITAFT
jgi:hypothetical protein